MTVLVRWSLVAALTLSVASVLPGSSAQAQEEVAPDFDALLDRAVQHYQAREYEQAIALFQQAFALRAEPEIVYNIARSYERLARPTEAIAEYERFVALPGSTSELRTRAHESIRALRAEVAASRSDDDAPTDTVVASTPVEPPPSAAPPPPSGGSVLGPVGWTMFGIGAASVGVGIGFGVLTMDQNAAFERATLRSEQVRLRDSVRTNALIADVLFIAGGVIAATGLVLAIIDATSGSSSDARAEGPSILVLPYASADSAGLTAVGAF